MDAIRNTTQSGRVLVYPIQQPKQKPTISIEYTFEKEKRKPNTIQISKIHTLYYKKKNKINK